MVSNTPPKPTPTAPTSPPGPTTPPGPDTEPGPDTPPGPDSGEEIETNRPQNPPKPVAPPVDPNAAGADAVRTSPTGLKVGWQQPPKPPEDVNDPKSCVHMAKEVARKDIHNREIGDKWVCSCGQVFIVTIGEGGNKIMAEDPDMPSAIQPLPEVTP